MKSTKFSQSLFTYNMESKLLFGVFLAFLALMLALLLYYRRSATVFHALIAGQQPNIQTPYQNPFGLQDLKYPIPELDNCRDAKECFYYCQIPSNQVVCAGYAYTHSQAKVLGESDPPQSGASTQITFPISQLGNCGSMQECSAFCNKTENRDACAAFAQQKGLRNESGNASGSSLPQVSMQKFIEDMKRVLGCDYQTTCKDFCTKTENRQKCMEFFQSEVPNSPIQFNRGPMPPINMNCQNNSNQTACRSLGMMCSNFCRMNPNQCVSTSRPGPTPRPFGRPEREQGTLSRPSTATGFGNTNFNTENALPSQNP